MKRKFISLRPFVVILAVIFLFGGVISSVFISKIIIKGEYEAESTSLKAVIETQEIELKQYQEQAISFIDKQYNIRSYINELVELLYARESYLGEGIGGSGEVIELNEQTSLFQLRQALQDLDDDVDAMKSVKDYLVARRNFAE
ncbi:MAG: hypothetical protein ACOC3V_05675, partial [bacterium]